MSDAKITQFNEMTAPAIEDLLAVVDDPSGSPETQKITLGSLFPRARVYNSGDLTISNNTTTALTFDSERLDSETIHSTVSNTGRLTAPRNGFYIASISVEFESNSTGLRVLAIRLNGSTNIAIQSTSALNGLVTRLSVSAMYYLLATHYVDCTVYQNSGGNLDVLATTAYSPEFSLAMIGPSE